LFDHRKDVNNADEMFAAVCDFVKQTTNGGTIKPSLGVFRPRQYGKHDFRIWNKFMIAYAGYMVEEEVPYPDGPGKKKIVKKIGDQGNLEFTQVRLTKENYIEVCKLIMT
jgi:nitric oxide synthase oxygenase domain/subunit